MSEWWGIKRGTFLIWWLGLTLIWALLLAAMQALGPVLDSLTGAAQSPLFRLQTLLPAWQSPAEAWLWTWGAWGGNALALLVLGLGGLVCAGACVADWKEHVLPDQFTLLGGGLVTLACLLTWGWQHALLGALLGWLLLWGLQWVLRRKHGGVEQLGCGDVKFMILLGAMVGPFGLLPLLALGCVLVVPLLQIRRAGFAPFGPALALGTLLVLALGLRWPLP